MIQAEIIAIGDELLAGQTIDTNSGWLAQQLAPIGIEVVHKQCIRDTETDIQEAFNHAVGKRKLVFFSGGLGPTRDDVTKKAIAKLMGVPLVRHQPTYEFLQHLFSSKGLPMNHLNEQQADVPAGCVVLPNSVGTAPGLMLNHPNTLIFILPGVPHELKAITEKTIIPFLTERYVSDSLAHRYLRIVGIPESKLAQLLTPIEDSLPPQISLAYLPNLSLVRLRLTLRTQAAEIEKFTKILEKIVTQIAQATGRSFAGEGAESLEEYVLSCLQRRSWTLSTAESCTGGGIAARLTQVPGASQVFKGGVVAYSNELKTNLLGVSESLLEEFGAVSEEVVRAMVVGATQRLGTDCALAVSGIAGPTGEKNNKPVGTVCFALKTPTQITSKKFIFGQNRNQNIELSILTALDMVRRYTE